jgi:hypothetical protein
MAIYNLSPAERRERGLQNKQLRLNRVVYNQYLKQKEEYEKQQEQIAKQSLQKKNVNFFERVGETIGDFQGQVISGFVKGLEGIYDFGASIVGGIGGIFSKDFQDSVKEHVSYDFTGNHITSAFNEWFDDSYLNDGKVGHFIQNVASGVGQMLPAVIVTVATGGAGAGAFITPGMATMGASAMGNATESAFNEGAGYYQGMAHGAVSGAVEMATEKLGAKMFGNTAIDDALGIKPTSKTLFKQASTKGGRILQEMASEGLEEGVAELVSPLTKMTYKGTDALNEYKDKEFWGRVGESAAVGAATSLAFGETVGRINRNTHNANEKLSELKSLEIKEDNLHAQGKLFEGGNEQKIAKLRADLRSELSQDVSKMSEKTRVNYIAQNNLGDILNADGSLKTTTTNSAQNIETTSKGGKNGLASVSNKEAYSPKYFGKEQGLLIQPTSKELTQANKDAKLRINQLNKGKSRVGFAIVDDGAIKKLTGQDAKAIEHKGVIYIEHGADVESSQKVLATHELNHTLEGTKQKAKFDEFVIKSLLENETLAKRFGDYNSKFMETFNRYRQVFTEKYGDVSKASSEDIAMMMQETDNEVISQYVSETMFTDEATIERLASTDESIFKKVYNWIKSKVERFKIKSAEDRQVYDFLHKAESLYKKALENSVGGTNSVRYSIDKKEEKSYSKASRKVVKYIPYSKVGNENVSQIRRELSNIYSKYNDCVADGIAIESGNKVFVVDSSKDDGDLRFGIRKQLTISNEELRKEYIRRTNYESVSKGFVSDGLSSEIRNRYDNNRRGNSRQELGKELSVDSRESTNNKERISKQDADRRGIKYSLSKDSDGNSLTEAQAEFFKDSKVRDKNGNLLVVFHGTEKGGFTEFNKEKIRSGATLYANNGDGFYFTENKAVADKYGKNNSLYSVYLNLKNPFVFTDSKNQDVLKILNNFAKKIGIEEKYNWENYVSANERTGSIMGYYIKNGKGFSEYLQSLGYDGIVYNSYNYETHKADKNFVAFESNQIKEITNIRPTFNNDIRFALSKDTEVKDLVAIHNTTESKLLQTMELGGFPMPSIAIIKDAMSHENFGDISIIFKADTINPQKSYDNKVYSADAYSPRFPQIAYSFNGKELRDLAEKMNTSVSMLEANDFSEGKSRERIIDSLKYNDNFIKHYVKEFNVKEEIAYKEPSYTNTCFKHEDINKVLVKYSFDEIVNNDKAQSDLKDAVEKAKDKQEREFRKNLIQNSYDNFMRKVEDAKQEQYIFDILKEEYDFDRKIAKGEVAKVEDSYQTRQNTIEKLKNDDQFNEYVESIVDKVINKKYLRNNKDYYTSSGNPRSFDALHESYNAENAVRIMKEQGSKNSEGGNIFGYGIGEIRAALSKSYYDIEEMHKDKHRLQATSEESTELYEECNNELHAIADEISKKIKVDNFLERRDIALNAVFDIIASTKTNEQAKRLIKRDYSFEVNDSEILKIRNLAEKVAELPVKYFEAKPERVVNFNEIAKIFVPEGTNQQVVEFFKEKGIDIQSYGENTPTRAELVKTLPQDIKFALSKGQVAKDRANNSKMKVYSKIEAEKLINEIIAEKLNIGDKFGTLRGKSKAQAINQMFIALNSADAGYRVGLAQNIADYIIENAIYEDMYDDGMSEDALFRYNAIKEFRGKLNLSSIKGEIHHKFDTRPGNAIMMQWGTTKGGQGVDTVAQELQEYGIRIDAINEADIFFEMLDVYNDARDTLNKKAQKIRADYFNSGELKTLKNELVRDILKGYDKYGTESKFSNLIRKYVDRIALLKETIKDLKGRNKAINSLFATIDKVNGLEKFKSADIELSNEVLGLIKLLKGVKTYRNNLSKNVREIMLKYSQEVDGKKLYDLVANNGDGIENPVAKMVEDIAHANGELTTNEIRQLDEIMKNFIHNVKEYNRVFFEGKIQNDEEIVKQAIKETKDAIPLKKDGMLGNAGKFTRWLTAPVWRFERLSSYRQNGVMTKIFGELQQGVNNQAKFNMIVAEHFNKFFKENKKIVSEWNKPSFELGGAKLSRGQVITLYMLFQRKQAVGHLLSNDGITGTIRIANEKHASKGNFKDALAEGIDIQIDYSTLDTIKESLTDVEKEFIKLSKEFFDKISKDAKYQTDMSLYGISNVGEENYIPIRVADDQIYKQLGSNEISFSELFSVYNASFNKETKPNAKNKIVVENIMDVINRHSKQMASYYGLAVPLKTLNRLYNKKLEDGSKLSIEINKVDPEFERYISKLLGDLQGRGNPRTTFDKVVGKIRSLGAKAALGLNLKVLANQFVSLPASHAIGVDYKNIMKGFAQATAKKTNFDKLTEYCPMLYDRFREGSNIDVGLLKENQGVFGKIDALTELTTAPIGKIDKFICGAVWNACLEQTKDTSKYDTYSDEHYKEAAKLTEKAVIKTQANYTALYRPAILREQNSFLQLSTMFMSEPLQQLSLLASSIDKIYVAKQLIKQNNSAENQALLKQAKAEAKSAITAVMVDAILLALIAQAFKWVKGQDDEETVLEGITDELKSNFIGMIPFLKDIYSLIEGYDVTNMAYTGLTNVVNGMKEMYNIVDLVVSGEKYTETEIRGKIRKTLIGLSQTFGIPLRNLETYTKGLIEKFAPSFVYMWEDKLDMNYGSYKTDLTNAVESDNDELADTIIELMLEDRGAKIDDEKTITVFRDLYKEGFDVFPKNVSDTIVHDNESIKLTKRQYEKFKKIYGQANDQISSLINSKSFTDAPSVVKAKSIKYIYDYYYEEALKDLLGIDSDEKKYLFAQAIDITKLAMIVAQVSQIVADTDKSGKTISGSRKAKVVSLINSMNLTATQKYMLMGYFGYKNTNGERQVKTYVQSLKLTKTEKETLFKMCGY